VIEHVKRYLPNDKPPCSNNEKDVPNIMKIHRKKNDVAFKGAMNVCV